MISTMEFIAVSPAGGRTCGGEPGLRPTAALSDDPDGVAETDLKMRKSSGKLLPGFRIFFPGEFPAVSRPFDSVAENARPSGAI